MTSVDRLSSWQSEDQEGRQRGASGQTPVKSRLPVSIVVLSAACGVLTVSLAYASGRLGHGASPWADRFYWIGQSLVLVPIAVRLIGRRYLTANNALTLIIVLSIAEYLITICYSPAGFTFADELYHWRSTTNVLQSGRLSLVNYALPISPHYPGLEEVTSALVSVTGLSIFTCGLIIAGVAHLIYSCLLYQFFYSVSRSYRIAGIGTLIYFGTPGLTSFNSMFVYETLALAFLGLAVVAARKAAAHLRGKRLEVHMA